LTAGACKFVGFIRHYHTEYSCKSKPNKNVTCNQTRQIKIKIAEKQQSEILKYYHHLEVLIMVLGGGILT
jgi:hypothetical protein